MAKGRILVVDDEDLVRWSVRETLEKANYRVEEAADGRTAVEAASRTALDLAILDMRLPDMDGISLFKELLRIQPEIQTIVITAYSTVENAVEAMKLGAFDYLSKPFNLDELSLLVGRALETSNLRREVRTLRREGRHPYSLDQVVGTSAATRRILGLIEKIAPSEAGTILLRGESGVGKDMLARVLHYESRRSERPFMTITCTTLQETLLESELFGHEKGAFTDARTQKKGLLEVADGGTVYLDEIGDMGPGLQAKLLRFLEEKAFRRVGGTEDIRVDVRVVAATNRDLEQLIREGKFREDLYYRLNVMPVYIPPLRERREDILALVEHFIGHFNREFRKNVHGLSAEARQRILEHRWPGNVRELRNVIERAMLLCSREEIGADDLLLDGRSETRSQEGNFLLPAQGCRLEEVERSLVQQALRRTQGNQTKAARLLGLSRDQIRYRMKRYGLLDRPASKEA